MLDKIDYFIYDLHSGKLDDLEWGIKALTKTPLDSEKVVIVISSVLAWGANPHNMVEDKPVKYDEDGNVIEDNEDKIIDDDKNNIDDNMDNADVDDKVNADDAD